MNINYFRRTALIVAVIAIAPGLSLYAQTTKHINPSVDNADVRLYGKSIEQALANERDNPVGQLTVGEIENILNQISVAKQEYQWVKKSELASLALPGLGQYLNGDAVGGTLFLSGDLLLFAGTLVGAYFLLPSDLQFSSINYFTDSARSINDAWANHSFVDYLPSLGALAGGFVLQAVLRGMAAHDAGQLARENIREKRITFEPEPLFFSTERRPFAFGIGGRLCY